MKETVWNSVSLANAYSQLAGVLAGFTFVALASYLLSERDTDSDRRQDANGVASSLFAAFATLVLVAVLYSLLTGEPDGSPRANLGVLITGVPFGLSIVTLFYSLTIMAVDRRFEHLARTGRLLVVFVGPVIVFSRLNNAVFLVSGGGGHAWSPHKLGWILMAALAVVSLVAATLGRRFPSLPSAGAITAHASLVISIVAAGLSAVLVTKPPGYNVDHAVLYVSVVLMAVTLAAFAICAASAISAESRRAETQARTNARLGRQLRLFEET